jgi:4-methyl-5(b-hydroxyethyl)-thiazole monophosphate biosynthesis
MFSTLSRGSLNIVKHLYLYYVKQMTFSSRHVENGKKVACICAAPTVLKEAGVLPIKYTAHQSVADALPNILPDSTVIDGNIITSRGAGTAVEFGLKIVTELIGQDKANSISGAIHFSN